MTSLRFRFTLTLFLTSFAAVAVVNIVAHKLVYQRFGEINQAQAMESFKSDIAAYITLYGSWKKAQQMESFGQFERRRRALLGANAVGKRPASVIPDPVTPEEAQLPPPVLDEQGRPPFRFVLLAPSGTILMGAGEYTVGDKAPQMLIDDASPIELNGKPVALAAPIGKPNLNALDLSYLDAIDTALIYALIAASALALILGILFSRQLTQPLNVLTDAIRSMRSGNIHQKVLVKTYDEIGNVLETFNEMSEDLATAYDKLEKSNARIKEQTQRLKEISIKDELTQLYNRRHFNQQAGNFYAHAIRYQHPLVFMIGDIDHFKKINDTFSHATGDEVLRQIARIFEDNTRKNDLVARYGGEEFVIAFPETPLEQAVSLCERLREKISQHPWQNIHPELKVTMSMGLNADLDLGNYEQMLAAADHKLYQAKNDGRNCLRY